VNEYENLIQDPVSHDGIDSAETYPASPKITPGKAREEARTQHKTTLSSFLIYISACTSTREMTGSCFHTPGYCRHGDAVLRKALIHHEPVSVFWLSETDEELSPSSVYEK
jgi:hypothetical protein